MLSITRISYFGFQGYAKKIIFLAVLGILYIGNTHYAEKSMLTIKNMEVETKNLKTDLITLKSDYMLHAKRSAVIERASKIGLIVPQKPPVQIIIE